MYVRTPLAPLAWLSLRRAWIGRGTDLPGRGQADQHVNDADRTRPSGGAPLRTALKSLIIAPPFLPALAVPVFGRNAVSPCTVAFNFLDLFANACGGVFYPRLRAEYIGSVLQ
jgi:hypothetical protein